MKTELEKLLKNAYMPYSHYAVAAMVLMKDGSSFKGVNVENASYGATICAERVAITSAIAAGYRKQDFDKLYVMVDDDKIAFPCFLCRQVISEFFERNCEVILYTKDKEEHYKVEELLPYPFTEDNLK